MTKTKTTKHHYVDNKKFYAAIVEYRAACDIADSKDVLPPRLSNYIGSCIQKIAERLSFKPCFINYSFREEMIDDGIENCIMYFKDFNPEKTKNPFAYFTQIIYYAFLRRISKEERIRYTTYKFFHDTIITSVGTETLYDSDDNHLLPSQMYDNIGQFMGKFETREQAKKDKRKEAKNLAKFIEEKEQKS
jgi:hypothetical protein